MKNNVIRNIIDNTNGKFFTVLFVKKDGSLRRMNCRTGVKKYLKGGSSTTGHLNNLITVYDLQTKDYRNINLNTVIEIHIDDTILYSE